MQKEQAIKNRDKISIIFLLGLIIITGCIGNNKDQHPDNFYNNTGGWDYRRMPLIKPLELISNDKMTWSVQSYPEGYKVNLNSIVNINKIAYIHEQYYLFQSVGTVYVKGIEYNKAWFIIDTEKKVFDGYIYYNDFADTLNVKYNIQIDTLSWRKPDDYYKEFVKTKRLPWIPEWKKMEDERVKKGYKKKH